MNLKIFHKITIIVVKRNIYEIEDNYILNSLAEFKNKLQIHIEGKWIDKSKYMKLYNDKILDDIFNDVLHISFDEYTKTLEI